MLVVAHRILAESEFEFFSKNKCKHLFYKIDEIKSN